MQQIFTSFPVGIALLTALLAGPAARAQAPNLSGFTPNTGPMGTAVVVGGSQLSSTTQVMLGGVPVPFNYGGGTLTVTIPRVGSTGKMLVTNDDGADLSNRFTVPRASSSYAFVLVTTNFNGIDVGDYAVPVVTDIDGDNKLDLLVGRFNGKISRYEQSAVNSSTFNSVTSSFAGIDVLEAASPAITDLDGDGLLDLLVGSANGYLAHYEQDAVHSSGFTLRTSAFNNIVGNGGASGVAITDLDNDGYPDLLVGELAGNVQHWEQNSLNTNLFSQRSASFNGMSLGSGVPTVADIDGDGLLDVLVNEWGSGRMQHWEQSTTDSYTLTHLTDSYIDRQYWGSAAGPTLTDLDGDGLLDLLLGQTDGTITHYEQLALPTFATLTPASGPMGASLAVTGTGLNYTQQVLLGGVPAPFTINSATSLSVTVPRVGSAAPLQVTTLGGPLLTNRFTATRLSPSLNYALQTNTFNAIDVGDNSAPALADFSGNGQLDLLIGEADGSLTHYEQSAPNSGTFVLITANFNGIAVGANAVPTVTDLDGDGLLDLLIGRDNGRIAHWEQTTAGTTSFAEVDNSFNSIDVGDGAAPAIGDLDGDGLLDLLVGTATGAVQHFEQSAADGLEFSLVTATFNGIAVGTNAVPAVADLDGDGRLDLLVGAGDGTLRHYEQGAANSLTFALVTAAFNAIDVVTRATPILADVDGDGLLDLLIGKANGAISRYEQEGLPTITGLAPTSGPMGTTVAVTGTNLASTKGVVMAGVAVPFTVNSATSLSVTIPRVASASPLRVTTAAGSALSTRFSVTRASDALGFSLVAAPFGGVNVTSRSAPAVADFDDDGRLDLLVGRADGAISHYEQNALNGTAFTLVSATFSSIDVGTSSAPALTDLDGDALLDLLVGKPDGTLSRYEQSAANSATFTLVTASFNTIDVGDDAVPALTDLDGDGRLDLLVGQADGTITHYEQNAANAAGFTLVAASFNTIDVGSNSAPALADIDGDGLLDLLVGRLDGKLSHYAQNAVNSLAFTVVSTAFNTSMDLGDNAAPAFTDVDGDGLLDLLIGELTGTLNRYEQEFPSLIISTAGQTIPAGSYQDVTITGTGEGTMGGSVVVYGTFLVQNGGIFASACQPLTGPGDFTLATGATLRICDAAGITNSGATGAVRVTGTRSYNTAGIYAYVGSVAQSSGNGLPATVRSLVLDNPAGLTLGADLTVNSAVTLTDGQLRTGATNQFELTLGPTATLAETTDGYLTGTVLTTRTVSAGTPSSAFGGLGLTLSSAAAPHPGSTTVRRVTGTALAGVNGSASLRRYFDITAATNSGLSVTLQFGYRDAELNGIGEALLNFYRSTTGPAGPWTAYTAGVTRNAAANTITLPGVTGFSVWTLGSGTPALPVELSYFAAGREGEHAARLHWQTASEKNSARFEVERSPDGRAFEKLAEVAGQGSKASPTDYTYLDDKLTSSPNRHLTYYRLRQVDVDGSFSYSPVRVVQLTSSPIHQLTMYPNPAHAAVLIGEMAAGARVSVLDALGREVAGATANAGGTARLTLPAGLAAGMYVVRSNGQMQRLAVE
jgi:uncharacterized protein (DUF2141 family)